MGTLLLLSLAGNFVLGVVVLVRIVRSDDRLDAAELAAAIDYALDVLAIFEMRPFLRLLCTGQHVSIVARFPSWPAYRDRHMATSLDLAP